MDCDEHGGATLTPWRVATVRGEPYEVAGYKLTPVARVLTYAVGQGTLQTDSISGWAAGLVRVKPVAILADRDGHERRIALVSVTTRTLGAMLAAGITITFVLWAVRLLARRTRRLHRIH